MKVIKIKVKTIILVFILIFLTIPYSFYFIGTVGFGVDTENSKVKIYTSGLLKIYDSYPTFKVNKGKVYYMVAMSNYDYNNEVLYYYGNGMQVNSLKSGNMKQALIAKGYFEKGIELGEKDNYYINNLNSLINLEIILGNKEKALELIELGKSSSNNTINQMALINEIVYYCKVNELDLALRLCEENIENLPLLKKYKNTIYYLKGEIDKIEKVPNTVVYDDEYNEIVKADVKKNIDIVNAGILKDINFINTVEYIDIDENLIGEGQEETGAVKGRVIIEGRPIAYSEVILRSKYEGITIRENKIDLVGNSYDKYPTMYTNENGEFLFNDVPVGKEYELILVIPSFLGDGVARAEVSNGFDIIANECIDVDIILNEEINILSTETDYKNDEIVIKYEEYPEAETYGVFINIGGSGFFINELTNKNEIRIPLTNGSLQSFAYMSYDEDESGNLIKSSDYYLGIIKESEVSIKVFAYDKLGNIISSSNGYKEVRFKNKKLNKGEKLIEDNKIDEAYEWFREKLENEPNNKEYLYPMMRIAYDKGEISFADELNNRLEKINNTGFDMKMREWYIRE